MAAIDISSTSAPLNAGILQLQNGVAMSATSVFVTDQLNTPSILKLSTNLVQINGALNFPKSYLNNQPNIFITTQTQPDPNNFAFQAGSICIGTTFVQDGINPLQTGEGNNYIGLGGSVIGNSNSYFNTVLGFEASITVNEPKNVVIGSRSSSSTSDTVIVGYLASVSGQYGIAIGSGASVTASQGVAIGLGATTSTIGGFALGNSIAKLQIGGNFTPTARIHVKGLGATSATTALLIENSASTELFRINDAGSVSIGISTPNASAKVQIDSTTQGFLPPRMTTAEINAIVTPAEGLVAYNTTISHLCVYQSGAWVKINHSPM